MSNHSDILVLQYVERLICKLQALIEREQQALENGVPEDERKGDSAYTLKCMAALGDAVLKNREIFGVEPWHTMDKDVPLAAPGEYLLRLKDAQGEALPPYPAIMTFYENEMTADIDAVLFLCALRQFDQSDEQQVSVNVSARSLRDADFIRLVLKRMEDIKLAGERRVIVEIHETAPELKMSREVLGLFRKAGVMFALDDAGLSMDDVMRMAEFEDIADFIKLDRHSVCAHPEKPYALDHLVSLVGSLFPEAAMVAEGVKSAEHARELKDKHPQIKYVQGLYLPQDRVAFQTQLAALEQAAA